MALICWHTYQTYTNFKLSGREMSQLRNIGILGSKVKLYDLNILSQYKVTCLKVT